MARLQNSKVRTMARLRNVAMMLKKKRRRKRSRRRSLRN